MPVWKLSDEGDDDGAQAAAGNSLKIFDKGEETPKVRLRGRGLGCYRAGKGVHVSLIQGPRSTGRVPPCRMASGWVLLGTASKGFRVWVSRDLQCNHL